MEVRTTFEQRYVKYVKNWLDNRHVMGVTPMMSFDEYRLHIALGNGWKCRCGQPITLKGTVGDEFLCFRCSSPPVKT